MKDRPQLPICRIEDQNPSGQQNGSTSRQGNGVRSQTWFSSVNEARVELDQNELGGTRAPNMQLAGDNGDPDDADEDEEEMRR